MKYCRLAESYKVFTIFCMIIIQRLVEEFIIGHGRARPRDMGQKEEETITINFTNLFVVVDDVVVCCFSNFEFICAGYSRPSGGNLEFSLTMRSLNCSCCSICVTDADWRCNDAGYDISVHLTAISAMRREQNEKVSSRQAVEMKNLLSASDRVTQSRIVHEKNRWRVSQYFSFEFSTGAEKESQSHTKWNSEFHSRYKRKICTNREELCAAWMN